MAGKLKGAFRIAFAEREAREQFRCEQCPVVVARTRNCTGMREHRGRKLPPAPVKASDSGGPWLREGEGWSALAAFSDGWMRHPGLGTDAVHHCPALALFQRDVQDWLAIVGDYFEGHALPRERWGPAYGRILRVMRAERAQHAESRRLVMEKKR